MKRFQLITVEIRDGDREYTQRAVYRGTPEEAEKWANAEVALQEKCFYGSSKQRDGECGYWCNCSGETLVKFGGSREITEAQVEILDELSVAFVVNRNSRRKMLLDT